MPFEKHCLEPYAFIDGRVSSLSIFIIIMQTDFRYTSESDTLKKKVAHFA